MVSVPAGKNNICNGIKKYFLIGGGVLIFVGMGFLMSQYPSKENTDPKTLEAVFPLRLLRNDPLILDPQNTAHTSQYYLLENLGTGLLRDDPAEVRSYSPAFALHWERTSPKTWVFQMRPHLQWSDGSPITEEQIVERFESLKHSSSRHIVYLKELKRADFDEGSGKLVLTFNWPTNEALLHELSLADAVFLHPTNLTRDWKITSGPYFVEEYSPPNSLTLHLNRNSPLATKDSPQRVRLTSLKDIEEAKQIFKKINMDLVQIPMLSFRPIFSVIKENAFRVIKGFPTGIYYFAFNPDHPLAKNIEARREFAFLVQEAFQGEKINEDIQYENQFVPFGFSGRLEKYQRAPLDIKVLKNSTLMINWSPPLKDLPNFLDQLNKTAKTHQVTLDFRYTAYTEDEEKDSGCFVKFSGFVGNQRDALGSFSFLFSGDMQPYKTEASPYWEKITASQVEEERLLAVRQLHKKILDDVYAVPFMIEATGYATSNRIDLSRWNLFDMRMRFYDIRWR